MLRALGTTGSACSSAAAAWSSLAGPIALPLAASSLASGLPLLAATFTHLLHHRRQLLSVEGLVAVAVELRDHLLCHLDGVHIAFGTLPFSGFAVAWAGECGR